MNKEISAKLDALFDPYNRSDEPGCTIAIAREGQVIYRQAFGLACLGQGLANQPSTLMPAGSITKQFTCAALLLLQAEGKLLLSDRVGKWIPELAKDQQEPTLAQIMRHEGGVRCYLDQWMFNGYRSLPSGLPWKIQTRQETLNFSPGSRSSYSNGGYLLLSEVVSRVSKMPFADFLEKRIFCNAQMPNSRLSKWSTDAHSVLANTYMRCEKGEGWTPALKPAMDAFGDGGMTSCVDDLLRWAKFLRNSDGPISLETLAAPSESWSNGPSDYRYGLIFQDWRGVKLAQHAGGLPGANSAFLMVPDHNVDVVVLFNRNAPATDIAMQALEIVLADTLKENAKFPSASEYDDLIGTYFAPEEGFLFAFSESDEKLMLSFFGDKPFPVERYETDSNELPFWADAGTAQIRFRRRSEPHTIDYFDGRAWSKAERLDMEAVPANQIAEVANGQFFSIDGATSLSFEAKDDQLFVNIQGEIGSEKYHAQALTRDLVRFWPPLFPASKLARLVREQGEAQSIIVSTPRSRALTFTRRPPQA